MKKELKSKCCNAELLTATADEGTSCYICSNCKNPTDPKYPDKECEHENPIPCNPNSCDGVEFVHYFHCEDCDKALKPQQPDKGELPEDWEKEVWAWITKEMPHKHSDRFVPLFEIIKNLLASRELPPAVGVKSKCCMGGCGNVNCKHCG